MYDIGKGSQVHTCDDLYVLGCEMGLNAVEVEWSRRAKQDIFDLYKCEAPKWEAWCGRLSIKP